MYELSRRLEHDIQPKTCLMHLAMPSSGVSQGVVSSGHPAPSVKRNSVSLPPPLLGLPRNEVVLDSIQRLKEALNQLNPTPGVSLGLPDSIALCEAFRFPSHVSAQRGPSSSSQGLTEDETSESDTTAAISRLSSIALSACTSFEESSSVAPATPLVAWETESDGSGLRGGRPEGKFPLFPEGRCNISDWHRIRSKRRMHFFVCQQCGVYWSTCRLSEELPTLPDTIPVKPQSPAASLPHASAPC